MARKSSYFQIEDTEQVSQRSGSEIGRNLLCGIFFMNVLVAGAGLTWAIMWHQLDAKFAGTLQISASVASDTNGHIVATPCVFPGSVLVSFIQNTRNCFDHMLLLSPMCFTFFTVGCARDS